MRRRELYVVMAIKDGKDVPISLPEPHSVALDVVCKAIASGANVWAASTDMLPPPSQDDVQ